MIPFPGYLRPPMRFHIRIIQDDWKRPYFGAWLNSWSQVFDMIAFLKPRHITIRRDPLARIVVINLI